MRDNKTDWTFLILAKRASIKTELNHLASPWSVKPTRHWAASLLLIYISPISFRDLTALLTMRLSRSILISY